ncbi:hypothetical protein VNO77_18780 [Canavalia gladiata]|uniref:Uncharacterized protein n=1 Tax=Canavalia gladiata TaxID=3824 RepID=A0AAN9QP02_CANGL
MCILLLLAAAAVDIANDLADLTDATAAATGPSKPDLSPSRLEVPAGPLNAFALMAFSMASIKHRAQIMLYTRLVGEQCLILGQCVTTTAWPFWNSDLISMSDVATGDTIETDFWTRTKTEIEADKSLLESCLSILVVAIGGLGGTLPTFLLEPKLTNGAPVYCWDRSMIIIQMPIGILGLMLESFAAYFTVRDWATATNLIVIPVIVMAGMKFTSMVCCQIRCDIGIGHCVFNWIVEWNARSCYYYTKYQLKAFSGAKPYLGSAKPKGILAIITYQIGFHRRVMDDWMGELEALAA